MRSRRVFHAVDSHTEGMPTRVITGGVGVIPGATMAERRLHFIEHRDDLRTLLMYEPRGHAAMSGAILQPPTRPDADYGVLFIEVSGCLPMCGHGTIGVATVLVETGMVEVGRAGHHRSGWTPRPGWSSPRCRSRTGAAHGGHPRATCPSFCAGLDRKVDVPGLRRRRLRPGLRRQLLRDRADLDERRPAVRPGPQGRHPRRRARPHGARSTTSDRPVHPEDPRIDGCHHVYFAAPGSDAAPLPARDGHPPRAGSTARRAAPAPRARMAQLHARGELPLAPGLRQRVLHRHAASSAALVDETTVGGRPAVVPTVTGRAWVTGTAQYLLDPSDPFPAGFLL